MMGRCYAEQKQSFHVLNHSSRSSQRADYNDIRLLLFVVVVVFSLFLSLFKSLLYDT